MLRSLAQRFALASRVRERAITSPASRRVDVIAVNCVFQTNTHAKLFFSRLKWTHLTQEQCFEKSLPRFKIYSSRFAEPQI